MVVSTAFFRGGFFSGGYPYTYARARAGAGVYEKEMRSARGSPNLHRTFAETTYFIFIVSSFAKCTKSPYYCGRSGTEPDRHSNGQKNELKYLSHLG